MARTSYLPWMLGFAIAFASQLARAQAPVGSQGSDTPPERDSVPPDDSWSAVPSDDEESDGPTWDDDQRPRQRWSRPPPEVVEDTRPTMGAILVGTGVLFMGGGLAQYVDAGLDAAPTVCDGRGCFQTGPGRPDPGEQSPGVALMAGGVATTLFGGVLLAHGLGDGDPFPHRSSRRLGAGILLTGYGFGVTVGAASLVMHSAIEGAETEAAGLLMFLPATGLLATGLPLWITGSRPSKRNVGPASDTDKLVYRSPTMASIGLGMIGVGLGIGAAGIGASIEAERREEEDGQGPEDFYFGSRQRPEQVVTLLATLTPGVALFSLGLPLAIIGLGKTKPREAHASSDPLPLPQIDIGPHGGRVAWTF